MLIKWHLLVAEEKDNLIRVDLVGKIGGGPPINQQHSGPPLRIFTLQPEGVDLHEDMVTRPQSCRETPGVASSLQWARHNS